MNDDRMFAVKIIMAAYVIRTKDLDDLELSHLRQAFYDGTRSIFAVDTKDGGIVEIRSKDIQALRYTVIKDGE